MNTFADVLLEMEIRTSKLQAEAEQERWARVARSSRAGDRASGFGRVAGLLSDYTAGLWCLLQRRFATGTGTAC